MPPQRLAYLMALRWMQALCAQASIQSNAEGSFLLPRPSRVWPRCRARLPSACPSRLPPRMPPLTPQEIALRIIFCLLVRSPEPSLPQTPVFTSAPSFFFTARGCEHIGPWAAGGGRGGMRVCLPRSWGTGSVWLTFIRIPGGIAQLRAFPRSSSLGLPPSVCSVVPVSLSCGLW